MITTHEMTETTPGVRGLMKLTLLVLAVAIPPAGTGWSQQPAAPQPDMQLRVYALKYASASEVAKSLEQFLKGAPGQQATVVTDQRTNAIILMGTPDTHERVATFLEATDVPERSPDREVRIFQLQKLRADQGLEDVLRLACSSHDVAFTIDRQRNLVVASGSREGLSNIAAVIEELDERFARAAETRVAGELPELLIRIVWLVSGLESESAPPPSEDLAPVVQELATFGIHDPRQVAQVMVHSLNVGRGFEARGSAILNEPCDLRIDGRLNQGDSAGASDSVWALEMSIHVEQAGDLRGRGAPVRQELCSLQSTVSAPFGHSIVLGATPIGELTSVFVVQVAPRPRKGK